MGAARSIVLLGFAAVVIAVGMRIPAAWLQRRIRSQPGFSTHVGHRCDDRLHPNPFCCAGTLAHGVCSVGG